MTSRMTVKKLCRNLDIYHEELNELRRDLDMLSKALLPVGDLGAQLSEGEQLAKMSMAVLKRQGSRFVKDEHKSQEWHAKQKEVDAEVQKVIDTMKKLAEQEEYALAQTALTTILKWLDDPEPDIRHHAETALEKVKGLKVEVLHPRDLNDLIGKLRNLPRMLFANMADDGVLTASRRQQLCRIPTVSHVLAQDLQTSWLLTRMLKETHKAATAVEYFERIADLRGLLGIDDLRMAKLYEFYKELGMKLAGLTQAEGETREEGEPPERRRLTLFPTLYGMRDKKDRIRVIDALVGTPVLSHSLNIMIGQPSALIYLFLDFLAITTVLFSTYRVAIEVAQHQATGSSDLSGVAGDLLEEELQLKHDLEMVYLSSAYVLVREMLSLYAYYSLGESMRMGTRNRKTISVMMHLRNRWKLLNIVSALSSIIFCVVASPKSLLAGRWRWRRTVGMLWLRMLGYIACSPSRLRRTLRACSRSSPTSSSS